MQIKEAEIFSFGKLMNKKIIFAPGINVIYGANEAGKTTLHDFLTAMLFGMEKGRGRGSAVSGYRRYEPWHAPAYYSGALRFAVGGRPFYLERNFYHREKRDILRNEADGEELSVAYGDLTMLLGGIHKETFANTFDIPQSGAATGKELSDTLAEYLSDAAESGNAGLRVTQAVEKLREKKRRLAAEQKKLREEREERIRALRAEQEWLARDYRKPQEDLNDARRKLAKEPMSEQLIPLPEQTDPPSRRERSGKMFLAAGGLFVGMVLLLLAGRKLPAAGFPLLFGAGGLGFLAFFLSVCAVVCRRGEQRSGQAGQTVQPAEESPKAQRGQPAEELLLLLEESLAEKETRFFNIGEQLKELEAPGDTECELQREIDAAELAANEIFTLSREFYEEAGDTLNSEVSRLVSAFTGGTYDSVRVDESGILWAKTEGKEVTPEALSRGTLEQFYLALRLAAGRVVTREEAMPVFLDDAFVMYDDQRLAQTLRVLAGLGNQVLLFTCQRREELLLRELGIDYYRIDIGN